MAAVLSVLGALIPILAKLIFFYMEQKEIDNENKKKFIEAVQSIGALKSVEVKDSFDQIDDEFDNRDEAQ